MATHGHFATEWHQLLSWEEIMGKFFFGTGNAVVCCFFTVAIFLLGEVVGGLPRMPVVFFCGWLWLLLVMAVGFFCTVMFAPHTP